jgi:hypothetical protein
MNANLETRILTALSARSLTKIETVQSLWSGYGEIARYRVEREGESLGKSESASPTLIIKHVQLPDRQAHPRGWNTDRSHQRKVRSYEVEIHWYSDYAGLCDTHCRVPKCSLAQSDGNEFVMVLEDLDAEGYSLRYQSVDLHHIALCLNWLAYFHVRFMNEPVEGLWPTGTYWHLETRPDELNVLDDLPLKQAASAIDQKLKDAPFQTLVHGDAKLANFCFAEDDQSVAAVDFQYVGQGCGMKDVAYFIGSCLDEWQCEQHEAHLLDIYFVALKSAITHYQKPIDYKALEAAWRPLYNVAWTDFHRFLKGWSPGHWKVHSYSERLAREVVASLTSSVSGSS